MKVLVIGGTGYIGDHTVKELLRRGHEVSVFARGTTHSSLIQEITLIKGDRHNPEDMSRLPALRPDAVIDINAYTREETQAAIKIFEGRLKRFVHLSTLAVCRETTMPVAESDPLITDPRAGYAYDKAECERALRWAYTKTGFPYVSVRPTAVFGPRDRKSRENYYLKRIVADDPVIVPNYGATPIYSIYVKDLAEVLANALEADQVDGRAYNLSQPDLISVNKHIDNIAQIAGAEAKMVHIPSRLLERLGFNLLHFPYFSGGRIIACNIQAARRDLGFSPTSYLRALGETVDYFLEQGPETQPSIEDSIPPVMPRLREHTLIERYQARTALLEDLLTDEWLNESLSDLND